ncbi:hypothetical protein KIW84_033369 [Lathyrus oleraceus]|uniref:Uncharacterized protein n=1 Tax=Pisum sativum TaxID=3888 RepID=A0A9D4XWP5_PEA|nr:hypothetical protein KIW84_033369 [Pisum sativum]
MQLLNTYNDASGQEINMTKSEVFFSRNLSKPTQEDLSHIMDVRHVLGTDNMVSLKNLFKTRKSLVADEVLIFPTPTSTSVLTEADIKMAPRENKASSREQMNVQEQGCPSSGR